MYCVQKRTAWVIYPFVLYALLHVSAAEIGFMVTEYSVSESESLVEVCVGITNGQSLDHGYGSATVKIVTGSVTATGKLQ